MNHNTLAKANYLSLETFRKSGVAVATPVWFAEQEGVYYIFSAEDAGKVKRLRNSSKARIAPCTWNGTVTGDWQAAQAQLLHSEEDCATALAVLRRKYGWQMCSMDFFSKLAGKFDKRAYIAVRAD